MPYAIPTGSILEATIQGLLANQTTLNTFHYILEDLLAIPDGAAFVDVFNNVFNAGGGVADKFRAACCSDWTFVQVVYQWITPTRFRRIVKPSFIGAGSVVDNSCPPNSAQVITRKGDVADRHGVGTLHVPSVPFGNVSNGVLDAAQMTRLSALAAVLPVSLVTGRMAPVLLQRANPPASRVITSATAQSTVRTMRRRTVGLGI